MEKKRILIIGATGVLGTAVSKHFIKAGFPVKIVVRNREKAIDLASSGAEVVVGDLTRDDWTKNLLRNVDVVITAAHAMLGNGKNSSIKVDLVAHQLLIDAAVEENVSHLIYTSAHGASPTHPVDFLRHKFSIEQYLAKSSLNYSIIRPPAFMEWHVHNLLGKSILEKNKVLIFGKGENPTNFIAVDDVVQVIHKIVLERLAERAIITVGGPENISKNEIAETYFKLLNVSPKVSHVPGSVLTILSKLISPFHEGIARVLKFSAYTDQNDQTMDENASIKQFGLQPTTINEFIARQFNKDQEDGSRHKRV